MGKDCGSWFPQQHLNWQSPKINSSGVPLDSGKQLTVPMYLDPESNVKSANVALPPYSISKVPQPHGGQGSEPCFSFYGLPRFRQAFAPVSGNVPSDEHISGHENLGDAKTCNVMSGYAQKRFIVFDHSGDQTTLIFHSGIEDPAHCLASHSPKPPSTCNLNLKVPGFNMGLNHLLGPDLTDELDGSNGIDMESEMHEDTEELNALLYSDDDIDSTEDDEVTSTGHSPSTMTANNNHGLLIGINEEVASSIGPTKKRKIAGEGFGVLPSLVDTASSVKPCRPSEQEDDAESICGNGKFPETGGLGSAGQKRMRKENIRETVSILQTIIPNGKGKDTVMVLDEAILYLKTLKIKARDLGLTSL